MNKKTIYHLGAYGRNLGDTVAIYKIRENLPDYYEFIDLDISKAPPIENINKSDGLLIGGGGLIEGGVWNSQPTGWKFKFDNLSTIKVPICVFGVGLNFFRGLPKMSSLGSYNLFKLIEQADYFSVRNDGSKELVKFTTNVDVKEIPDPGLIDSTSNKTFFPDKLDIQNGCLNISLNSSPHIMRGRKFSKKDLEEISYKYNIPIFPHTPKDMGLKAQYIINEIKRENYSQLDLYKNYQYVIAMRGHGQLVSIAKNIPGIYLASQNKVSDFAKKNGYEDYLVDTEHHDWKSDLDTKINDLCSNPKKWFKINNDNLEKFSEDFQGAINEVSCLFG